MRVHHLAVVVEDLPRAERFYMGVLGLELIKRWPADGGGDRSIWLALGLDTFLAVERGARRPSVEEAGWHCVAFRIEPGERETWRVRLAAAGHPVEKETAYTIYCRDPEGNLVGLSHYPET